MSVPAPSAPKAEVKLAAKLCVALVVRSVSSTVRTGSVPVVLMLGPSSLNTRFCPMLRVAWALSPSLSVLVAVKVTRLSAVRVFESSGLLVSGCTMARSWSRVTSPLLATLTVNTRRLVVAVRPSTTVPLSDRLTASPVAVSVRPEAPATTPRA
ncbi:hypothetical protein D3C78_697680 [compost metagenome]